MNDFARRRYIFNGVSELLTGDAPIVGCILNGGRTHAGTYGYRNRYGYGYGYASASDIKRPASESSSSAKQKRSSGREKK